MRLILFYANAPELIVYHYKYIYKSLTFSRKKREKILVFTIVKVNEDNDLTFSV